jgi:GMP synthase (glutamine-hydrolysing)
MTSPLHNTQSIFVFDFGGQYTHLIANRIRRAGAYSEIVHNDISAEELQQKNPAGIILSGGPHSVFNSDAPQVDPKIFELGVPILGICYGHQLIAKALGGKIKNANTEEFGKADFLPQKNFSGENSKLFNNFPEHSIMWMNHGDEVTDLPEGFTISGKSKDCPIAAMSNDEKNFFGVQFHPEVTHSEYGMQMLENFVEICGVKNSWTISNFLEEEVVKIQKQCEGKKVFLLVSGGVDSSVCFALLTKALGKDRVFGCLVDHGMMRKNEAAEVKEMLASAGFDDLHTEFAAEKFLGSLTGVFAPEKKRISIGENFLNLQAEIADRMDLNPEEWLLGQGTIYPDTIESGGTKHASKIKTHHNRVERIEKMIEEGKIIEPIAELYKDEVRILGKELGLPDELISRHPFPGPGLGVRILCAEKEDVLENFEERENFLEKKYSPLLNTPLLEGDMGGVTAKILPIRSVGVQGDSRSYRHPVVLFLSPPLRGGLGGSELQKRCKENSPCSQSSPSPSKRGTISWQTLEKIATEISNNDPELNRVLLSVSSKKAPEKFTVQKTEMTRERIAVLQEADAIVRQEIFGRNDCKNIWQFPVVLAPVFDEDKESIILRPIESENAMTATFSHIPLEVLQKIVVRIENEVTQISHIFYDLTNKPPGTIEWE